MSNHECNKAEVINIIRDDIKEVRKDIKLLLQKVSGNSVKVSLMGMISGGIGAAIFILTK